MKQIMKQNVLFLSLLCFLCACSSHRHVVVPANTVQHVSTTIVAAPIDQPVPPSPAVSPFRYSYSTVEKAAHGTWQASVQSVLDSLCNTELLATTQLGLYIYDITADQPLYAVNSRQRMRPASCQKLVTGIAALYHLGGAYQFTTDLCISGQVSSGVLMGDVYVVGGMDPLLNQDDLSRMAQALKQAGISKINGKLYMDISKKDDLAYGWGWCWDDEYGPMSALMVNAKDSFPTIWKSVLRKAGISIVAGEVVPGLLPSGCSTLLQITHSIDEVMAPVMKQSDNIYAESLFYQLAFQSGQRGAGRKQTVQQMEQLLTILGQDERGFKIADGSGLSLYNYATPELFISLLNYAYREEAIRSHLFPFLPIAGVDGTLKNRMKGTPAFGNVRAKTGSVDGISTLSGYVQAANGHILSFCIMNQGVPSSRMGRDFQDKICILLAS